MLTTIRRYMIQYVLITMLLLNINLMNNIVNAQIPCDDEYGQYCPEASGFDVGVCLKSKGIQHLNEQCIQFIMMHDNCKEDINTLCPGKEYTGDALGRYHIIIIGH